MRTKELNRMTPDELLGYCDEGIDDIIVLTEHKRCKKDWCQNLVVVKTYIDKVSGDELGIHICHHHKKVKNHVPN
jgi:hypothetical protein